jgi:hypothetical protein
MEGRGVKSLLDPTFKYTKAEEQGPDYLAKKFERMRREQKKREEAEKQKADEEKPRMLRSVA